MSDNILQLRNTIDINEIQILSYWVHLRKKIHRFDTPLSKQSSVHDNNGVKCFTAEI